VRIAVACGGTGGHIFPGLATAKELVGRGHDVTLWLAGRDVEADSVRDWAGPVIALKARGLGGGLGAKLGALAGMVRPVVDAVGLMRRQRPDVVLAMGSYASVGPGLAARWLGVPLVLHEGNAVPGRAVQFLARFASRIGTGFEAPCGLPARKIVYCGFPVRDGFAGLVKAPADPPLLLVTGGSQGAAILNRVMPEAVKAFVAAGGASIQVVHLTGRRECEAVTSRYQGLEDMVRVEAFSDKMQALYGGASLAVTRSGAATCTELALARVPALLVPFAAAPGNHQWHNAQVMARGGGFLVLDEQAFTPEAVAALLADLLPASARLEQMLGSLPGSILPDGAVRLADVVEQAAS
jgi:UDP-N-acetylglucosamine--N-acetylmuramyl-(pentapeptide) pyrophosphoryl-undecaprenol N-acetylglucosamine transferase